MSKHTVPAERAVVLTVGVPEKATDAHVNRVLKLLEQGGYQAAPTSDESLAALACAAAAQSTTEGAA